MKQKKVNLKTLLVLVALNTALLLTIATQETGYSIFAVLVLINGLAILRGVAERRELKAET